MSVTVYLQGGMGNQMFKYAAGRAASLRLNTDLKLNTDNYRHGCLGISWKPYCLDQWEGVTAERVFTNTGSEVCEGELAHGVSREPQAKMLAGVSDDCWLRGCWESERYFSDIAATIRQDFTPKSVTPEGEELAKHIDSEPNSAFISIRRGDYIQIGVCLPLDYYLRGAEYVAQQVEDPHFFIFSNDGEWVRQNLRLPRMTVARVHDSRGPEGTGHEAEDLWLMSRCRHAVVANSTFSWWGAWLNPDRNRTVVAPAAMNYSEVPDWWRKL